jgi:hypothetical protein
VSNYKTFATFKGYGYCTCHSGDVRHPVQNKANDDFWNHIGSLGTAKISDAYGLMMTALCPIFYILDIRTLPEVPGLKLKSR